VLQSPSLSTVIHVGCAVLLPPLLLGVINRVKAIFAGRQGPPLLQPYYDLAKLVRKSVVLSETTTWVFLFGPVVGVAAGLIAALIVPLGSSAPPLSFAGDFVFLAYLLALGRFFTMTAALDVGSAFEGMGAAREASFACLAEPVVFLGLLALTRITGHATMSTMLESTSAGWHVAGASLLLIVASWFLVLLVENCRIPFDDPNTHLELTMVHEVMVLDHSGPAFGAVLYGASVKLFVFSALIVRLLIPLNGVAPWLSWPLFIAGVLAMAAAVGVVESTAARLRLPTIPTMLVGACVMSGLAVTLLLGAP
jgi:formate hydrogenlyase subunit 4